MNESECNNMGVIVFSYSFHHHYHLGTTLYMTHTLNALGIDSLQFKSHFTTNQY